MAQPLPLLIVRQNMDGMEMEFANHLVEDSNNDGLSYTDCESRVVIRQRVRVADCLDLTTSHKAVTNEIQGGGTGKGIAEWRPW
jgi:protein transport protein SEC24